MTATFRPAANFVQLALQLNQYAARQENPQSPVTVPIYADTDALPPASEYSGVAICQDVGSGTKALVFSDLTDWYRADTGASL
jgi:hypothetical protein